MLQDFLDDQASQKENISEISEILIEKLNISYEDKTIIKNFNIKLEVPFCLKIDGKNGSGKTTLVRAIMGLIKLDNGNIKFNKSDINQLDKKTLDNIKFNPKSIPNKKEIIKFIKLFDLSDIFNENNLDDKIIEEEGKNLSQGQMQKISVIRALVNQYEVLILDEGLSNIDENNEKKIMKYLIQLYDEKKMNLIFISHKTNFDNYFKQKVSL